LSLELRGLFLWRRLGELERLIGILFLMETGVAFPVNLPYLRAIHFLNSGSSKVFMIKSVKKRWSPILKIYEKVVNKQWCRESDILHI
jgi:hypothetical protein